MKCKLKKQIDHNKIREKFRQTYIQCPLLKREEVGMNSLGVICGGCCVRLNQLLEATKDLILHQVFSVEEYKRNPEIIAVHLPEHLREYYAALKGLGKTMDDMSECERCKTVPMDNIPVYGSEKTEMTQCKRNDLR